VDAGHGGKDQGAKGVAGNVEKDFNLAVSRMLVDKLKQYPEFQVVATRSTDVFLELAERVEIANERDADLFISIHANSFKPETRGTETYYYNKN
ncbi:N-acetylmuramoyl-L-alanine amidase family protein, partial [Aeromonas hydrophila]|uniref:N-acetylmuramoyl-L-alanine amidase family protein n=1 Tax=Aeromonas hydrophila TaxID=644 RepID=UPI00214F178D